MYAVATFPAASVVSFARPIPRQSTRTPVAFPFGSVTLAWLSARSTGAARLLGDVPAVL